MKKKRNKSKYLFKKKPEQEKSKKKEDYKKPHDQKKLHLSLTKPCLHAMYAGTQLSIFLACLYTSMSCEVAKNVFHSVLFVITMLYEVILNLVCKVHHIKIWFEFWSVDSF